MNLAGPRYTTRMAPTRRAEVALEPEAFERLEERAAREGVSVTELIRRAVDTFLSATEVRRSAVGRIASLGIPIEDWDRLEQEIVDARAGDLP